MLWQPPVTTQPTDRTMTSTAVAAAPGKPRVLVADDSGDMRSLLRDVLESEGCDVVAVPSGARAVSEMNERPPDLVITDLFMPGMSGFALRALMLKRPDLATIPVIVLSAYWHRPSETLEVADVITKPINIDRLIDSVRRLVPAIRARERLTASPMQSASP
jgi:CheY-like chemotaxis protein